MPVLLCHSKMMLVGGTASITPCHHWFPSLNSLHHRGSNQFRRIRIARSIEGSGCWFWVRNIAENDIIPVEVVDGMDAHHNGSPHPRSGVIKVINHLKKLREQVAYVNAHERQPANEKRKVVSLFLQRLYHQPSLHLLGLRCSRSYRHHWSHAP